MDLSDGPRPEIVSAHFNSPDEALVFANSGLGLFSVAGLRLYLQALANPARHTFESSVDFRARQLPDIDRHLMRRQWELEDPAVTPRVPAERYYVSSLRAEVSAFQVANAAVRTR